MSFWSPESVRLALSGSWVVHPGAGAELACGVSTDSRTLRAGEVFVALAGPNFDGHAYLKEAARAGSPLAIVNSGSEAARPPGAAAAGMAILAVPDTRKALLRLGSAHRRALGRTRIIAIAGSNGKTTTVRMIDAILSLSLRGSASRKSFNNHVGVPLTLLAASPEDDYLVCEIGTNSPGEVAELSGIVRPHIAVITGIGREHLEGLGSLDAVREEEASILGSLAGGGLAIVNADAPLLLDTIRARWPRPPSPPFSLVAFGEDARADVRVTGIRQSPDGVAFAIDGRGFTCPVLGRHNALNAGAAVAAAREMGIADDQIAAGLARVAGAPMRLEPAAVGGIRIINDAYNANPESVAAALATLWELEGIGGRRVVVLADMLELGEHGADAHREVGDLLAQRRPDLIVLVGPLMAHAGERLARLGVESHRLEDSAQMPARIAGMLREGDLVLLKGSRLMRLERVVEALAARKADETGPERRAAAAGIPSRPR